MKPNRTFEEDDTTAIYGSYNATTTITSGADSTILSREYSELPSLSKTPTKKKSSGIFSFAMTAPQQQNRISSPLPIQCADANPKQNIIDMTDDYNDLTKADRYKQKKRKRNILVVVVLIITLLGIAGAAVGVFAFNVEDKEGEIRQDEDEDEFFCGSFEADEEIRDIIASFRVEDADSFPFIEYIAVDIECLPSNAFSKFENFDELALLRSLSFTRTNLNRISPEAFNVGNFENVEFLEFDSTDLTEILPGALDPMFNIRTLVFTNNAFTVIEDESIFRSLERLELISFAGNRFVELPKAVFTINSILTVEFQDNLLLSNVEEGINADEGSPFLEIIDLTNTPLGRTEELDIIKAFLGIFREVDIITD